QISVSPSDLNFGSVVVGQSQTSTLSIQNNGGASLTITGLSTNAPFSVVSPAAPQAIAAGGSMTVTVRFSPGSAATSAGNLTITSNDSSNPNLTVPLTGTGITAVTGGLPPRPAESVLDSSSSLATNLVGLFLMNETSGTTSKNVANGRTASFSGST